MVDFKEMGEYLQTDDRQVKVSIKDLSFIFEQLYNQIATSHVEISETDFNKLNQVFNKYLVAAKLRQEEATWFNVIKLIDSGKMNDMPTSKKQENRRDAYGYYIDAKHAREKLQKELEDA